ncbi:MAG: acetyltransferase [Tatlockia sp.]|jgi:1-acyl-sn-glycerol-3-phosphate acyltransferase
MPKQCKKGGRIAGAVALLLLFFSTLLIFIPVLFIGLLKLFPNKRWQARCTAAVDTIAMVWSHFNNRYIQLARLTQWKMSGVTDFNPKDWHLVVANHQSWLDIVILQRVFNRKIPVLKFFIKDQLKWVPLLGFSWWAMGCPFMKRYSKEYLAKNPHKKGKDLEATAKAMELFKFTPVSIMSFVEGTRYSAKKNQLQNAPYQHLLKPKAGGLQFVIHTMGQQFSHVLDVTIVYSEKSHSLWDFLCGRIRVVRVHVRNIPIPKEFSLPGLDESKQAQFRNWLNQRWLEKDELITELKLNHQGSH